MKPIPYEHNVSKLPYNPNTMDTVVTLITVNPRLAAAKYFGSNYKKD